MGGLAEQKLRIAISNKPVPYSGLFEQFVCPILVKLGGALLVVWVTGPVCELFQIVY